MIIKPSIIESKFKRSKLRTENTFLWKELPLKYKTIIESIIKFTELEHPILCYCESPDYFWILTDTRLIILDDGITNHNEFSEINNIELNDLFEGKSNKINNRFLKIIFKSGHALKIKTEENTWPSIYNIIRFVVNASKNT